MIILFGLAGSGKGTQGQALAKIFGWRWISNGEVIRNSHKYDEIINQGKLIPDQDVIDMMNVEIRKAQAEGRDVVLDGYPRDETQARYLMQYFADQIRGAIVLEVPKEELYRRLSLRGRDDDHSRVAIDRRFAVFEQGFEPISHLLAQHHIPIRHVDGLGSIEEVTERLLAVIRELDPEARVLSLEEQELNNNAEVPDYRHGKVHQRSEQQLNDNAEVPDAKASGQVAKTLDQSAGAVDANAEKPSQEEEFHD